MSYDDNPKWAPLDIKALKQVFVCPSCGKPFNTGEQLDVLSENTYYQARHIPDVFIFNCTNTKCKRVDLDTEFKVKVTITAELSKK